ncbi:beta-microseminoprotein-like [Cavia porcellus]|uniref:beta-microseminoprotein-like n=1 Tax=Cavia porcellus TaxID=10141 RepID=UPI002FDF6ED5
MSFLTFQKVLLGSLLVLAISVTSCSAHCYIIPLEGSPYGFPAECKDLVGITHSVNSKWVTSDCEECACKTNGISCCNTVSIPVGYDKNKCQSYFHKENCTYTVVEIEDPRRSCIVDAWIL